MEITVIVLALLVLWFFGRTIRTIVAMSENMAVRGLKKLDHEQKKQAVDYYSKVELNEDLILRAKSNKTTLDELNI